VVFESTQKGSRCHPRKMETKVAPILIREPRVRALRLQYLEKGVDLLLPVGCPFMTLGGQKSKRPQHPLSVYLFA
jgi:hypothetical protein